MARLTGARIICEHLVREGVEVVFGYPGGANLPLYDAMLEYPIKHVLVRHEQNAGHAADGFARASGKVGVAFGTSGPGATYLVTRLEDLASTLREAFHLARSGRPGPVLIDVPKDLQNQEIEFSWPPAWRPRLGESWRQRAPEDAWTRAAAMIREARRPVVLAGHGVLMAGASEELQRLCELTGTPAAFTLLGLGGLPATHPLALGMMGMHGEAYVNKAIQGADLLIALGMRFDDRVTGKLQQYAPGARKIHFDIDAAELNKNVRVDLAVHCDLKEGLRSLLPLLEPARHDEWLAEIDAGRQETAQRDILSLEHGEKLWAAHVIHDLWEATRDTAEVVVATDVGQHQMWVAQYYRPSHPRTFVWSGGLGTMGFGVPAAMGAKFARPRAQVWAVVGDGGFQMSIPELATLQQEGCAVKIAVINNGYLGMVRQWQELFHGKRYASTPLLSPDLVKLAEAYGMPGIRVTRREEVKPAVARAMELQGPVLVEFQVEKEDMVWPMVAAGSEIGTMLRRPVAPQR